MIQFNNIALNINPDGSAAQAAGSDRAAQSQTPVPASVSEDILKQLIDNTSATDSRSSSEVVLQALKAAGLSPSDANIDIVNLLIQNNMPISRESIRQTLAQVHAYPSIDAETIINMNKASVPVNAESVATVSSFLANESILSSDISELTDIVGNLLSGGSISEGAASAIRNAVTDYLANELQNAVLTGNPAGAASIQSASVTATILPSGTVSIASGSAASEALGQAVEEIASMAAEQELSPGEESLQNEAMIAGNAADQNIEAGSDPSLSQNLQAENSLAEGASADTENAAAQTLGFTDASASTAVGTKTAPGTLAVISDTQNTIPAAADEALNAPIDERLADDGRYDYSFSSFEELTRKISESAPNPSNTEVLSSAIREELGKLSPADLKKLLRSSLLIRPRDLSKDNVKALYERTSSFLSKVKDAAKGSELAAVNSKAAAAQKDLEMLNSLNRVHPHIELPLKLKDSEAQGGLYVYTNRKGNVDNDGHFTALLHLKLPDLGPVDIHLDLRSKNLQLSFYSEEDAGKLLKSDIESLHRALGKLNFTANSQFKGLPEMKTDLSPEEKTSSTTLHTETPSGKLGFDQRA